MKCTRAINSVCLSVCIHLYAFVFFCLRTCVRAYVCVPRHISRTLINHLRTHYVSTLDSHINFTNYNVHKSYQNTSVDLCYLFAVTHVENSYSISVCHAPLDMSPRRPPPFWNHSRAGTFGIKSVETCSSHCLVINPGAICHYRGTR